MSAQLWVVSVERTIETEVFVIAETPEEAEAAVEKAADELIHDVCDSADYVSASTKPVDVSVVGLGDGVLHVEAADWVSQKQAVEILSRPPPDTWQGRPPTPVLTGQEVLL